MANRRVTKNIILEDTKLIFRNFSGKVTEFNKNGEKNFSVLLTDDFARQLEEDGWKINYRKPKEDDPDQYRQPFLKVKVKFGKDQNLWPEIYIITSRGKKRLYDNTVGILDVSRILSADMEIRPYNYEGVKGRIEPGVAAYLKSMYVTIVEDRLDTKYADIPEIGFEDMGTPPFEV